MDYKTFKMLAEGFMKQSNYSRELREVMVRTAEKHHATTDFLGLPFDDSPALNAILEAIELFDTSQTFAYFFYECDADYDKFNKNISWEKDGKKLHPDCHNLKDLWHYITYENCPQSDIEKVPVKEEGE